MPKRTDIHSILVIGAGPIVIGSIENLAIGGTTGTDTLNVNGFGTASGLRAVAVTGSSTSTFNLTGTAFSDNIEATPEPTTASGAVVFRANNLGPILTAAIAGAPSTGINVAGGLGNDTLTVNGGAIGDFIAIDVPFECAPTARGINQTREHCREKCASLLACECRSPQHYLNRWSQAGLRALEI